jgi:hypothetical protein
VVALWVLARVRYPDRPAVSNAVPPLLTQLAPRATLTELAAESAQLRDRLGSALLSYAQGSPAAALRIRDDTAITWLPDEVRSWHGEDAAAGVVTLDRASGLAVVKVDPAGPVATPVPWTPRELGAPRYLLASIASGDAVALRPVFVAALQAVEAPAWSGPVWLAHPDANLSPGTFVFTTAAEIAGLVVPHERGTAIVPAQALFAHANRLLGRMTRPPGSIGVEAEWLTRDLAAATGARTGVVVSWIDPRGPAADGLVVGDVIEAADGQWVESLGQWTAKTARLSEGDRIVLGVRRQGEWRDVQLLAAPMQGPGAPAVLGLQLRSVAGAGTEVVQVERLSAGEAAGLLPGDVITRLGTIDAPTPAQMRQVFASTRPGDAVLIAFARGSTPRVAALRK